MEEHPVAGEPQRWLIRLDHDRRGIAVVGVPLADELEQASIERQERQFPRVKTTTIRPWGGRLGAMLSRRIDRGSGVFGATPGSQPRRENKGDNAEPVQGQSSAPGAPATCLCCHSL